MSYTPMMQQYLDIKADHQDALLMFRLGDFYELFFEDAKIASKALGITLTGREAGGQERVPMCGVPFHAGETYITRLIDHGFSVAICEQTEDAKQSKGLVRREVVRVVTPGTALRDDGGNRFLAAILQSETLWGLALLDLGTGEVWCAQANHPEVLSAWLLQQPIAELLVYEGGIEAIEPWLPKNEEGTLKITRRKPPRDRLANTTRILCTQYHVPSLLPLDLAELATAAESVALVIDYIQETQKQSFDHIRLPKNLFKERFVVVDTVAQRNLELLETGRTRQRRGSLLGLLDKTKTAMGGRRLRHWLERPLHDVAMIDERLDAVDVLASDLFLRYHVQGTLDRVYDLERLVGRISFGTATPRDLLAVAKSLAVVPEIQLALAASQSHLLATLVSGLPDLSALAHQIDTVLVEEPPLAANDGGVIRLGVSRELDELRDARSSAKEWLTRLEQTEREQTGIRSLKVGFNKVFGYFIEVSKANSHLVPAHYERKQTLSGAERYVVGDLKVYEEKIFHAEERAVELELQLFRELRERVLAQTAALQTLADLLADIDALTSLGQVSAEHQYTRPILTQERGISIRQGRHPVVEANHPGQFVPNDVRLDDGQAFILITGPNMAGKSTYMRQTALIVLLAHIGCFVPAEAATIGLVDRIFTRIGASDDLGAGQSTFMVEMVELAQILRQATTRSLVLLDEVGRGTSTYDGLSIAEAVMEALRQPDRSPLTLFATHYHELTEAADKLPGVANYSVLVRETADSVAFLHSVVDRPADRSYGIQVARLAGIPNHVIKRATQLLELREQAGKFLAESVDGILSTASTLETTPQVKKASPQPGAALELPLFAFGTEKFIQRVAAMNILQMTPLEAMSVLNDLARDAKEVLAWDKSGS